MKRQLTNVDISSIKQNSQLSRQTINYCKCSLDPEPCSESYTLKGNKNVQRVCFVSKCLRQRQLKMLHYFANECFFFSKSVLHPVILIYSKQKVLVLFYVPFSFRYINFKLRMHIFQRNVSSMNKHFGRNLPSIQISMRSFKYWIRLLILYFLPLGIFLIRISNQWMKSRLWSSRLEAVPTITSLLFSRIPEREHEIHQQSTQLLLSKGLPICSE